jgi:hypothetical protein
MHAAASASAVPVGLILQTRLNSHEIAEHFFEFESTGGGVF